MSAMVQSAVEMPRFLEQVSQEFYDLASEIERLQDTISELLGSMALEPRLVEQAQALDHVFQHMSELGAILSRAADQASPRWQVSTPTILASVSLSNLARRLAGRDCDHAPSGEIEMF
jgi:hypothetical protein